MKFSLTGETAYAIIKTTDGENIGVRDGRG